MQKVSISGLGAIGFLVMIIGAAIFAGIFMLHVINKADLASAYLWGGLVGAPGAVIFSVELIRAMNRSVDSE